MAKPNVATGGGGGVDETKSAPTIDQPTPPPADQAPISPDQIPTGDAPPPVVDPGTVTLGSVATGSGETVEVAAGIPSSPCFDYNPETGKPNLRGDETMLSEKIRNGVRVVVTTSGRKIFCCSLPKFCEAFGPPPMPVDYYLKFFPWAK